MLEPGELRLLTYAALGHGVKGIKYYMPGSVRSKINAITIGFLNSAPLTDEIRTLNDEIKQLENILSQALPISVITVGSNQDGVRVYTLWSGDDGMLVIARNLNYTTDRRPNKLGAKPRFRSRTKEGLSIEIEKPAWLRIASLTDPLTQQEIPYKIEGDKIRLELGELSLTRIVWIKNSKM